ncbi:TonB family protein [Massilia sp. IC2-278]|uniref:energy transducer TonB n=1 Tax=Massilia sp. IC2-278 TaxID=2887200 RepID=UPI001E56E021|nr:TonB family protein [Massilia sp. IC2-278]MCC2963509.1 TonB family protein [Massilia sp. IC2-278]
MKILLPLVCALALAAPLSAFSQAYAFKTTPSVARPGPGDKACKRPEYPKSSVRNGEEGTVTLEFVMNRDGAILEGKVLKSSGFVELDRTALVALAKCAFKFPEGKEEPASVILQYVWTLE